ncbi:MAG TPA: hypothetical protein VLX90_09305 [Steroidobacteraceae bacterium]|nr:hypothetical protein [Steroidobacteraceae bacterium]
MEVEDVDSPIGAADASIAARLEIEIMIAHHRRLLIITVIAVLLLLVAVVVARSV